MDFLIGLVLGYVAGKPDASAEPLSVEAQALVGGFLIVCCVLVMVGMLRALKRSL